ncbi:MAG: acyl-CoA dehydrogenase family protein [Caldilineaceae bacterium]
MYSFDMTPEQKMLVETVHRFAAKEMRATFRTAEETHTIPAAVAQTGWELGLLPGNIEPAYGGFGEHSALTSALYLEELGWGDVGIALHLLTPNLFALPVALWGDSTQKETYLEHFCTETFPIATAAVTEAVYQFDWATLGTSATKDGDSYVIRGQKTYVPLAAEAQWFLVYAQENGMTQAFIVPHDTDGVRIGSRVHLMGANAWHVYDVNFDTVQVPAANRLGGKRGIRLSRLQTISRLGLSALAVGQARAAYEYALSYAKERTAFGDPIAQRQSIAFMLANMRIEIEAARLLLWEAAYKFDQREDATKAAFLAKQYADKMVLEVTDSAVQILGGHGYVREHPVELWLRNGRGFAIWEGLLVA